MKNVIAFLLVIFTSMNLSAQDTAKVLIVESRGQLTMLRPGQKIKVQSAGIRRPDKGMLGEVTDSTIRIDNAETGSRTVRIADIREITWYDKRSGRISAPALIVIGGVATIGGVLILNAILGDNSGGGIFDELIVVVLSAILVVPLTATGVILMTVGILNADSERSHTRKIDRNTRLSVSDGKPANAPSTTKPEKKRTTVE